MAIVQSLNSIVLSVIWLFSNRKNTNYLFTWLVVLSAFSLPPAQAQSPDIEPLPVVTGTPAGYIGGSFAVSETGSATYAIDITAPPGTAGMAPQLSLNYNSRSSNGMVGIGWSLSGLSGISRCGTSVAQDGFIDSVDFDDNDKFCLDGQRLLAISGVYGADGAEYRTENESFAQIFSYGTAGNGPELFIAKLKSGLIYSYGTTSDSRVEAQGKSDVLSWNVARVEDTLGNYFTVTYAEDSTIGESYPLRIDYSGNDSQGLAPYNSVQFGYESRSDTMARFVSGSQIQLAKRLKTISTFTDSSLAWQYNLTYTESPITFRSQLTRIEECDSAGVCILPTDFTWQVESNGHVDPQISPVQESGYWVHWNNYAADFNGDGLADIAAIKMKTNGTYGYRVKIFFAEDDGQFSSPIDSYRHTGGWGSWKPHFGDFNGDGMADIAAIKMVSGSTNGYKVRVNLSDGDGTFSPLIESYVYAGSWGKWSPYLGDFNGDGLTDIAAIKMQSDSSTLGYRVRLNLSNGDGTFSEQIDAYDEPGPTWGVWSPHLADFNGDGLTDIAAIKMNSDSSSLGYRVKLKLSNGDGTFSPIINSYDEPGSSWGNWKPHLADFNGDGLTDIAAIKMSSNGNLNYRVRIKYSLGDGSFSPLFVAYEYTGTWGSWNPYLADFNGDGLTDIAAIKRDTNRHRAFINFAQTDGSFSERTEIINDTGNYSSYQTLLGDYDGDGVTDFALSALTSNNNKLKLHNSQPGHAQLLSQVTNGHGMTTTINYKPLTDYNVYSKDTDAIYPARDIQGPMYVVSDYEQDNGIGGTSSMSYHYSGLKTFLNGRGFCGFREITITNEVTGIQTDNMG